MASYRVYIGAHTVVGVEPRHASCILSILENNQHPRPMLFQYDSVWDNNRQAISVTVDENVFQQLQSYCYLFNLNLKYDKFRW